MAEIINSIDRALDVLLLFYYEHSEMGITEIANKLNINKTTVYRILNTLEKKGFVVQNKSNEKYWLGTRLYSIGLTAFEHIDFRDKVRPYVERLYQEIKESVNISVIEPGTDENPRCIVILNRSDTNQQLNVYQIEGASSECYCSAVGKCLMAFNNEIDFSKCKDEYLYPCTEFTKIHWKDIILELDKVKKDGFAIEDQEAELGLCCIGAPIFDKENNIVAAISITGPRTRLMDKDFEFRVARVKKTANDISKKM